MGIVYQIKNKVNGKIYIGKTEKTLKERILYHEYSSKYNSQSILHKAIRKYGIQHFEISIIEETILELNEREKFWINEKNSLMPHGYNMTLGGEGGDTSQSPNYQKWLMNYDVSGSKNPMFGKIGGMKNKIHSEESKKRMSLTHSSNWKKLTEEQLKQRSKKILGKKNGMFGKIPSNSLKIEYEGIIYNSLTDAYKQTGLAPKTLRKRGKIL